MDAEDISRLYADHARGVLRFCARRTFDAETAVDLVAEVFALAFEQRRTFRGSVEAERVGWLYGIARNVVGTHHRRGDVHRRAVARLGVERRELRPEEFERIEELAGLAELRARVAAAMTTLPADQREAVRLRVVDELDYPEVAQRTGVSEQTVRARVSRGLRALERQLDTGPPSTGAGRA
ncbi:sigma-70 family RNA polymerase sigma factor [Paraconexibacter sp. AEG42_29]|uniref:RNA polymerase sigma factor n=1 Tax=Paraconexibacter sp. AEG42_29 TaxID=2997339 RepID=UPI00339D9DD2